LIHITSDETMKSKFCYQNYNEEQEVKQNNESWVAVLTWKNVESIFLEWKTNLLTHNFYKITSYVFHFIKFNGTHCDFDLLANRALVFN